MTPTIDSVRTEIETLHAFLAGWLSGRLNKDKARFTAEIDGILGPGFYNVQPAGRVLTKNNLLEGLWDGYGMSPDFDIRVTDVVLRQHLAGDTVVATYVEHQRGARNSPPFNVRLSTAVLAPQKDRYLWHTVHETWLPETDRSEPVTAPVW